MITIKRETDYACRVILHLALLPEGERVTAQDIARRRIIPRAMVRRVITRLAAAHLITTARGQGGGLSLARPASQVSLLNVVEAMEGTLALNACVVDLHSCPLKKVCPVHAEWCRVRELLAAELGAATFDKLAAQCN
jgi:Rrf2 family protein